MIFFFYGTLLDREVLRLVLPQQWERLSLRPAILPGYRRVVSAAGRYPVLERQSGAFTRGSLASGFDRAALFRMAHFEGPDYLPACRLAIGEDGRRVTAGVFLPRHPQSVGRPPWCFQRWERRDKKDLLRRTRRWMSEMDALEAYAWDIDWLTRRRLVDFLASFPDEREKDARKLARAA